jgi:hypothetical protein
MHYLKAVEGHIIKDNFTNFQFITFQHFVMSTENTIYNDVSLLLKVFPRMIPRAAPNFLQTLIVKKVRSRIAQQSRAQGMGRHSRYFSLIVSSVSLGFS